MVGAEVAELAESGDVGGTQSSAAVLDRDDMVCAPEAIVCVEASRP